MKKRMTALLLAALLLLPLTACGSSDSPAQDEASETAGDAPVGSEENSAEPAPEEPILYTESLEKKDFAGASFRLFTSNYLNSWLLPTTINCAVEETGEVVNDTLFARDRWLEETYNIDMEYIIDDETPSWQLATVLKDSVLAGADAYDLIIEDQANAGRVLTTSGCAYPLNYVEGIRLDADYWFPKLNNELRFGDNLFIAASVISPRFYGSTYVNMFNRNLALSYQLEDLYGLVESGKWTLDKMDTMAQAVVSDLDGDGAMTDADQYGYAFEGLTPIGAIIGCGYHVVSNQNGELTVMLKDEGLVNLYERLARFFGAPGNHYIDSVEGFNENDLVYSGRYLFLSTCTFNLADYRDIEYDYGILPMPKLNEQQDAYYSYAQPWVVCSPVIPLTVVGEHLEAVGTVVNAMAAYGLDYVRPAVFENVIMLKGTRDEQSERIVSDIFDNITFDLVTIYKFGELNNMAYVTLTDEIGASMVTKYAAVEQSVNLEIEKFLKSYEELAARLDSAAAEN